VPENPLLFAPQSTTTTTTTTTPMVHEISSTIDWCEDNWVYHDEVAEFWNTVSNVLYIWLALLGIYNASQMKTMQHKVDFTICSICGMMVGIGSAWFHGRLTYAGQMFDEIWMLIILAYGSYLMLRDDYPKIGYAFAVPLMVISFLHIQDGYIKLFQWTFGFSALATHVIMHIRLKSITASWPEKRRRDVEKAAIVMALMVIFGTSLWLTEELLCKSWYKAIFDPHLHAFWHFFTAYALYGYSVIYHILLTKEEGYFAYKFGFLPYVSTQPSASASGKPMQGTLKQARKKTA